MPYYLMMIRFITAIIRRVFEVSFDIPHSLPRRDAKFLNCRACGSKKKAEFISPSDIAYISFSTPLIDARFDDGLISNAHTVIITAMALPKCVRDCHGIRCHFISRNEISGDIVAGMTAVCWIIFDELSFQKLYRI